MSGSDTKIITDVPCTVCGCVCDDLRLTIHNGEIVQADRACSLAEPWFLTSPHPAWPRFSVNGQSVTQAEAITEAARLLQEAQYPLIYGLSRSTTEGQRAAVALAEQIGGTIDTSASTGHAPSIMALQQVGESTCTLGEVKQRADLVIFWGADPVVTHPRHIERYCPPRPGRHTIVIDSSETETAKIADEFLAVPADQHWETLWALRLLLAGEAKHLEIDAKRQAELGIDMPRLGKLVERMKSCQFGIIFFGRGVTRTPRADRTIQAMLQLVTDLNNHTRFYARRMRRFGDVAGADSVLTWQTGYPFGVNFSTGYPRYNPGEFTGPELLAHKHVDLALIVGSETAKDLPAAAMAHLQSIPVILLDPLGLTPIVPPSVHFTTAVYGIHRPGTAYRMDEVPIPLRTILDSDLPSDGEVLQQISSNLHRSTVAG